MISRAQKTPWPIVLAHCILKTTGNLKAAELRHDAFGQTALSEPLTKPGGSTSFAAPSPERRAENRLPFTASGTVVEPTSGTKIHARVSDIGLGGCYLDTTSPLPEHTVVSVAISRENVSFRALGKVAYALAGRGFGIEFTFIEPEHLRILEKWVAGVSGESAVSKVAERPKPQPPVPELPGQSDEQNLVLHELIIALMRRGVLSEADGKSMLRKLLR